MTRALLHITAVVGWLAVTAFAAAEKFEVASVRISPPGSTGQTSWSPMGGGTFAATNISLPVLIEMAFGVDEKQISGIDLLGRSITMFPPNPKGVEASGMKGSGPCWSPYSPRDSS